jgi:transposase
MKASSIDLREKIVTAHFLDKISIRKVAQCFGVSKSLVQKLVRQQRIDGNLEPKKPGKPRFSHLTNAEVELRALVTENHDATLVELCELFATKTGNSVSKTAMCLALQKLGLNRKKADALRSGFPTMEAHQAKRCGVVNQKQKESRY